MAVVAIVGAATCFFAATVGMTQWDIKLVIAYSTCSQLGDTFAAGVGAYGADVPPVHPRLLQGAAVPGAGSVIHAMHYEQDMRFYGGLRKHIPFNLLGDDGGRRHWFYIVNPRLPKALAEQQHGLYNFLLNKWYFDEIYDFLFVRPALWVGRFLWRRGDGGVIDGGINGLAMGVIPFVTRLAGRAQSGYLFHYAFAMVLGLLALTLLLGLGIGR